MMGANDDIDTVPYQESLKLKIYLFLRGFRVYKLAKLVWLHGAGKIEEIRNHPLDDVEEEQEKDEYIVIREQYTPEISILREKWAIYMDKGKFEQAGAVMKQAIELKPDRPDFYILLLDTYGAQKKYKEAEELIARVLKMFPECQEDVWVLYQLGFFYRRQKKYDKAEEVLKKAIKIQPEYREVYAELATVYREQGKINKLQKICDDIIAQNVESGDVYGFVATSYYEIGMYDEAERYYQKANEFRLKNYKEATRYNYQRLKEIVAQIGIQLVCVQYPVRNVEELKKLFESREGMIFVDNENLFRVALRYGSYEDYFFDNFAGDFGHCTPKGNRLLAESVADRILKEYFSIKN